MRDSLEESRFYDGRAFMAVVVVALVIATAFAVTGLLVQQSRAEILTEVPLQWQKYVNAAIERGDIPRDASAVQVKDWLSGQIGGMSENTRRNYVNPFSAKTVAEREAALGSSEPEPPAVTGTGKILVLLVEFAGTDCSKSGCVTGPLHNQVAPPGPDNNVDYWISDFSREHYMDLLFGKKGLTLVNYYKEQSSGLFTVDGYVSAWVQIKDHSEWWYGADSRSGAGSDDLNGPVWRFTIDAVKAAYDTYGTAIPWYDFDTDKDGWIDSLMVVHAGAGQEGSGASWTIWSHSWFVDWPNGYSVFPDLKVGSYTTEPENEAVGVFAHEYGHQLGLPDEYDVTYLGESPVGFLGSMASGSWGPGPGPDGRIVLGVSPSDFSVWDKYVLGWLNGQTSYFAYDGVNPISGTVGLSQIEGSRGTRAIKVELPRQAVALPLPKPYTGTYQWYSGFKPDVTDVMTAVQASSYMLQTKDPIDIPSAGAKLQFWEWYNIESYYDFGFVEVSTNGATWAALPGRYTTNSNPFGGNPGNGITGYSKKYVRETMDLASFAGSAVYLRFRLTQDGAVYYLGWTVDDVVVTDSSGSVLFKDLVTDASPALWERTATDNLGPGWSLATATAGGNFRHYYMMEWRNFVGFDATLATSYQFVGTNTVEFWSHTPGLLIWYRNFAIGDNSVGLHPGAVSIGVVDAHPEPLLRYNGHYWRQRIQLMDAAFGLRPTIANTLHSGGVPITYGPLAPAPTFDDGNSFFYSQFLRGTYEYIGLKLPTYGVTATVLGESRGLTGATVFIDAAPLS